MFAKSIRWRMQLWLAFLLVCILSGFGITAYQLHRTNQLRQIDEDLARRVSALGGDLRARFSFGPPPGRFPFEPGFDPPFPRRPSSDSKMSRSRPGDPREFRDIRLSMQTQSLFAEDETNSFYYVIWSRGGSLLKRSTNAPPGVAFPGSLNADARIGTQMRETFREAFYFNGMGECALAGRSLANDLTALRRFAWWLAAAGGAVLALGLGGGWLLASRALRPVEEISASASRISAGNLSERINVADTDNELGHLAGVLNSTFARLEAAFAQQKQFTADASHELRTPLAVLISETQTTLARERNAAEYRETVEGCLDTAQQMKRLTQSLLELARYDAGQEPLERERIDLAERTRACIELVSSLARERGLQIHSDLAAVDVLGDADRLGQVIINLLTNAIQYNRERGEVRVTTKAEPGAAVITVADTGQGISAADLPHVFERFYRGDKSRVRTHGRSGLGLAIAKAIVEAHGGSIQVSSQPGVGSTFTVRLPSFSL